MEIGVKVQTHLSLSDYINRGDANTKGLLGSSHPVVELIEAYYEFFAKQLWVDEQHQATVPMFLSLNAFTLWTGGVRMALSGHEAAVYPLLRTALESACYARVMTDQPDMTAIWSARHDGETQRKACRKAFAPAVSEAAGLVDATQPGWGDFVLRLYDANIDFGAHPNPRGVMSHVHDVPAQAEEEGFGLASVYPGDSLQVFRALIAVTDTGRGVAVVLTSCLPGISEGVAKAFRSLENKHAEVFPPLASEAELQR